MTTTTLSAYRPNRLHSYRGNEFRASFGDPCAVFPLPHINSEGHRDYLKAVFVGAMDIEITRDSARCLAALIFNALGESVSDRPADG